MASQVFAAPVRAQFRNQDIALWLTAAAVVLTMARPPAEVTLPSVETPAPAVATKVALVAPAAPAPAYSFGEPVAGYPVVSPFGLRQLPWEEHGRLHQGVDIAAPSGLPVRATAAGEVVRAGRDGGYGRFVEVRHADGLTTLYAHLGSIETQAGATVAKGDAIGRIGSSGVSTGAHLHYEVRDERGRPLNPTYFIGKDYAEKEDLPLKAAARTPRHVRLAHVSFIPEAKRELMEAREAEKREAAEAARLAKLEKTDKAGLRLASAKATTAPLLTVQAADAASFATEAAAVEKTPPRRPAPRVGPDGRVHGVLNVIEVNAGLD